jgi:hypothetical protein
MKTIIRLLASAVSIIPAIGPLLGASPARAKDAVVYQSPKVSAAAKLELKNKASFDKGVRSLRPDAVLKRSSSGPAFADNQWVEGKGKQFLTSPALNVQKQFQRNKTLQQR